MSRAIPIHSFRVHVSADGCYSLLAVFLFDLYKDSWWVQYFTDKTTFSFPDSELSLGDMPSGMWQKEMPKAETDITGWIEKETKKTFGKGCEVIVSRMMEGV